MTLFTHLVDAAQGKHPLSAKRSSQWPKVRAAHLKLNPVCAVCGGKDKLEVHHQKPFHLDPGLELNPENLITLCEAKNLGGLNCHLVFGHLGNYKSYNASIRADAAAWSVKFSNRPMAAAS